MKLKFIGYAEKAGLNPDGTVIYQGQPIYFSSCWGVVDGYFLIEQGIDPTKDIP